MKALRIPTTGPIHVVKLAPPEDHDATAFLATAHAAIGCHSAECDSVGLTDAQAEAIGRRVAELID